MTFPTRLPLRLSHRLTHRISHRFFGAIVATALTLSTVAPAFAKPPEGVKIDPAIHEWFEALVRADGVHCCGVGDCRVAAPNEVRTSANGYEVLLNGGWEPVPDSMVIHRENGPLAATIVCKSHYESAELDERLYCVIPYAGG